MFRHAVWLFPAAFTLHVLEEYPGFTRWAQFYASDKFTQQDYKRIHLFGIVMSAITVAIVSRHPNPIIVFLFFAFILAPSLLFNSVFHGGASIMTRDYCPGVITAVLLYLPVFVFLSRLAWRENLIGLRSLAAILILGGAFHTWEVGRNVFKAW